jgi:hypothetical protein
VTRLQYGTGWGCKAKKPMDALTADRIQFAFTLVFHYLFPQLTMGLALLILILKTIGLRTANEAYHQAAHFGRASSRSTSLWGWSLAFPWSFSSVPTGPGFRERPEA